MDEGRGQRSRPSVRFIWASGLGLRCSGAFNSCDGIKRRYKILYFRALRHILYNALQGNICTVLVESAILCSTIQLINNGV